MTTTAPVPATRARCSISIRTTFWSTRPQRAISSDWPVWTIRTIWKGTLGAVVSGKNRSFECIEWLTCFFNGFRLCFLMLVCCFVAIVCTFWLANRKAPFSAGWAIRLCRQVPTCACCCCVGLNRCCLLVRWRTERSVLSGRTEALSQSERQVVWERCQADCGAWEGQIAGRVLGRIRQDLK